MLLYALLLTMENCQTNQLFCSPLLKRLTFTSIIYFLNVRNSIFEKYMYKSTSHNLNLSEAPIPSTHIYPLPPLNQSHPRQHSVPVHSDPRTTTFLAAL